MKQFNKEEYEVIEEALDQIISTSSGRRLFLQATPLLLAACATTGKSRYREGDNSGQETSLTVAQEQQMTAQVMPKMQKDYPRMNDSGMQTYIAKLGRKIAMSSNLEGNPYKYNYTVVDVPGVNAFALPAGTVFVTAPLIAMAESEAELAGVIGHEIGHIQARHAAERMHKAEKSKGTWLSVGGGVLGAALGYGAGKLLCKDNDRKCKQNAVIAGAGAGVGGALLIHKYKFMANSREDEMEADRIGFRTSVKAGYDARYVGRFYEKLLKMESQSKGGAQNQLLKSMADAMSTHPPSAQRVKQMRQMASEVAVQGRVSSNEFASIHAKAKAAARRHNKS